jgi:hypothetical protein
MPLFTGKRRESQLWENPWGTIRGFPCGISTNVMHESIGFFRIAALSDERIKGNVEGLRKPQYSICSCPHQVVFRTSAGAPSHVPPMQTIRLGLRKFGRCKDWAHDPRLERDCAADA